VIASPAAASDLLTSQGNLIAVEMESAGVASAAFSAVKQIGFMTVRGICDFADSSKNDDWHEYAANAAASYLRGFVEARPVAQSDGNWPSLGAVLSATRKTPAQPSTSTRKKLFEHLCAAFDIEEFKNLCFILGIDIDELPGDRKSGKVRELILLFERRGTLGVLEEAVQEDVAGT